MGLDQKKIYLPSPEQDTTTGAISVAPTGTELPTDAKTKLPAAWESGGYVGSAGIVLTTNTATTAIKDWSQATVRKALSDFAGQIAVPFLQIDEFAAVRLVGESHVTATDSMLKIELGPHLGPIESYVFSMKDGDSRIRVVVPSGQFESIDAITFSPGAEHLWSGTLSCYPVDGVAIIVIYEDGTVITGNVANKPNQETE